MRQKLDFFGLWVYLHMLMGIRLRQNIVWLGKHYVFLLNLLGFMEYTALLEDYTLEQVSNTCFQNYKCLFHVLAECAGITRLNFVSFTLL